MENFPHHVFREYDIRGLADGEITPQFSQALAKAYLKFLPVNVDLPVVVGRDVRLSGEKLQTALIQALLAAGKDVIDVGVVPTPLVYYTVFTQATAGCMMVTASHNPAEYNGFKMMVGKQSFHGEDIQKLKDLMLKVQNKRMEEPAAVRCGQLQHLDMRQTYTDFVVQDCPLMRPLKVVVDAGNGPTGLLAAPLYRKLGCEVIALYCEPDGRFPNHHPDPTIEANLKDLSDMVVLHQADLGIAFDGDGDRIGVVDEKGKIIWGDMLLLLLSRQLLKQQPKATIVSEAKSSQLLYDDIQSKGGKAIMWRTGHSLMKAKMKETGALLAGEMSGHFFFADRFFGFDDATYAGARVMQLLAEQSQPLSTLLDDVPKVVNTPEILVPCADEKKFTVVGKAKAYFAHDDCEMIDVDGMRLVFEDGWALLRASNTQPALTLRFEAKNDESLTLIRDKVMQWLAKEHSE
ncbi:MAG: phosphomannomutase/phosphoglucomutase [Ghiorsea sp.]|nr:phosphomannomutase/phosphoglucomutase [Ghiorsea sp.]